MVYDSIIKPEDNKIIKANREKSVRNQEKSNDWSRHKFTALDLNKNRIAKMIISRREIRILIVNV